MNEFKSKMHEKIKQYSKKEYLDGYINKEFLTSDKDADIYYFANDEYPLIDPRTGGGQKALDANVFEYLEEKSDMLDNDIRVNFHIMNANLSSKEQGMVKHMIKEHYAIELYKVQKEYNKCKRKIVYMILFGLFMLAIYFLLNTVVKFELFDEVISLIFSFSIWEALDCLIFTLSDIKKDRNNITQDLLTSVVFDE